MELFNLIKQGGSEIKTLVSNFYNFTIDFQPVVPGYAQMDEPMHLGRPLTYLIIMLFLGEVLNIYVKKSSISYTENDISHRLRGRKDV